MSNGNDGATGTFAKRNDILAHIDSRPSIKLAHSFIEEQDGAFPLAKQSVAVSESSGNSDSSLHSAGKLRGAL